MPTNYKITRLCTAYLSVFLTGMSVSCAAFAASTEQQQAQSACENAIRIGDSHKSFGSSIEPGFFMFLCSANSIAKPAEYWNCKAERYKAGESDSFAHSQCDGKH
jgi:hypothetical protein